MYLVIEWCNVEGNKLRSAPSRDSPAMEAENMRMTPKTALANTGSSTAVALARGLLYCRAGSLDFVLSAPFRQDPAGVLCAAVAAACQNSETADGSTQDSTTATAAGHGDCGGDDDGVPVVTPQISTALACLAATETDLSLIHI